MVGLSIFISQKKVKNLDQQNLSQFFVITLTRPNVFGKKKVNLWVNDGYLLIIYHVIVIKKNCEVIYDSKTTKKMLRDITNVSR